MPKAKPSSRISRRGAAGASRPSVTGHPVIHPGRAHILPQGGVPLAPQISQYVTVSWNWTNQAQGNISWTFVNSDQNNSHAVVLYRNNYIFGGAFWPVYLGPDDTVSQMLDGTQPIPTLSGNGGQPMGILDYGPSASPRYLVHFIFNLAPGQTWSTPEGGFTGITPTAGACYALTSSVAGNYCVGYDPARVADWDSQTKTTNRGYSPNPNTFYTYAFTPEPATPENTLGFNDSIGGGTCAPKNFYFVTEQNYFGRDEVQDNLDYPLAFYLFLEGFTPNAVGSSKPSFPIGSFNSSNIPGLSLPGPTVTYDVGNTGTNATVPQRIRFGYGVDFTAASLASPTAFPAAGGQPNAYNLGASISILGQPDLLTPQAEFYLLGGDDPYFTNVRAVAGSEPYLSQDLRVFTGTPATNNVPVNGNNLPVPSINAPTLADSISGAYSYIQNLITWLNKQYGYLNPNYTPPDTNTSDPLDSLLPDQGGALYGDSTVNPKSGSNNNYNFAIARVRLKGSSGPMAAAANVKVFFRLFTTQTFDTDFINSASAVTNADPNVTYPSTGALNDPQSPLPGTDGGSSPKINGCSLPFFATKNYDNGPSDYATPGANNQTIEIPSGQDYAWAFYGCFLNVYDQTNIIGGKAVQNWLCGSAHNCLVAQIAYNDAPIENENGVIENPTICNKLAQRNLQVNACGNPGFPATHRVPQTIDVRPSPPSQSSVSSSILSYPDEMMIDWGTTPLGSVASIYWPDVSASSVLQLASQLYPEETLTATDANTVQCQVVSPVTYIPIPPGSGGSFAGLMTVELPASVRAGNEFEVVVRRITTRQVTIPAPPPPPPPPQRAAAGSVPQVAIPGQYLWRYITGSFLVKIPVQKESTILPGDENLLAILKWRLGIIGTGNRWYPVLLRWISYLSDRINGMGGNASGIPPSPTGYQPPSKGPGKHAPEHGCTGKVNGVVYDRFGDFEGFHLLTEEGHERRYFSREAEIEDLVRYAWAERVVIRVLSETHAPEVPVRIILLRVPPNPCGPC
ncbi:MAG: hypothetical protein WB555_10085 [Candidatus Korobacteraceae bacterium]